MGFRDVIFCYLGITLLGFSAALSLKRGLGVGFLSGAFMFGHLSSIHSVSSLVQMLL